MRVTALVAALALALAPAIAGAVTVHTVSAQRLEGKIAGLTPDGDIAFVGKRGRTTIPFDKVFRIVVHDRAPQRPIAGVEVLTVDGTRLLGALSDTKLALAVRSQALGRTLHFKVARLLGVRFSRDTGEELHPDKFDTALAETDRTTDLLYVETKKGIIPFNVAVERVTPKKVFFNWNGEDRSIDTARVAAVIFANPETDPPAAAVRTTDASVVRGDLVAIGGGKLTLDVPGGKLVLPMANVLAIEVANPNVAYLSGLRPVSVREVPFFNHVWKHRVNLSVAGNPITLDGRRYARGIGCHTKTVLTYDLGGGYKMFAAVIGIDDEARPRGSVAFSVQADGKQLHAVTLTGRDKAVALSLPVAGVKRLTLVTGFADDASVGDHAAWADARVMK